MNDIEEVILRSRQEGRFSTRHQFTMAKEFARKKMQHYSLRSPSHYILEFIQGAVAAKANYVDISITPKLSRIAWTGGGFTKYHLSHIFDFLISDTSIEENRAIQKIALGLNALLQFQPCVTIESGDGTLQGSFRIEVNTLTSSIKGGIPEDPINGTYILARNMKNVAFRYHAMGPKIREEILLIEERCLLLSIPVIVNDDVFFRYGSRTPKIFGVESAVTFDQGDLYGTLGKSNNDISDVKLLTYGVWIETISLDLGGDLKLRGQIGFDSFSKTADHSSIVKDKHWNEMKSRISILTRPLLQKNKDIVFRKGNQSWKIEDVLKEIRKAGGVVLFSDKLKKPRTIEYEKVFHYPAFIIAKNDIDFVKSIFYEQEVIVAKNTLKELDYYSKPAEHIPDGPFFLKPKRIQLNDDLVSHFVIYSPRNITFSIVEFIHSGRIVERREMRDFYRGFLIRVHLEAKIKTPHKKDFLKVIRILESKAHELERLSEEIMDMYTNYISPGKVIAHHALCALSKSVLFFVNRGTFSLRRLGTRNHAVLDSKLLQTKKGKMLSIREILSLSNSNYGLLYLCPKDDKASYPFEVICVDEVEEKYLKNIFGEAVCFRIDKRKRICSVVEGSNTEFYIDSPFVVKDPLDYIQYDSISKIESPLSVSFVEEAKELILKNTLQKDHYRALIYHLIWILVHPQTPPSVKSVLKDFPLFLTKENIRIRYSDLNRKIKMEDGWNRDLAASPLLLRTLSKKQTVLATNSFLYHLMSDVIKDILPEGKGIVPGRSNLRKNVLLRKIGTRGVFVERCETRIDASNQKCILSYYCFGDHLSVPCNDHNARRGNPCTSCLETKCKYKNSSYVPVLGMVALMPRQETKTLSVIDHFSGQTQVYNSFPSAYMCAGEFVTKGIISRRRSRDNFIRNCVRLFGEAASTLNGMVDLQKSHDLAEPALFGAKMCFTLEKSKNGYNVESNFPEVNALLACKLFPTISGIPLSARTLLENYHKPSLELDSNARSYQKEWLDSLVDSLSEPKKKKNILTESYGSESWIRSFLGHVLPQKKIFLDINYGDELLRCANNSIFLNLTHPRICGIFHTEEYKQEYEEEYEAKKDESTNVNWATLLFISKLYDQGELDAEERRKAIELLQGEVG